MNKKLLPILYALLAAVFYALNAPFSKLLLQQVPQVAPPETPGKGAPEKENMALPLELV